MDEIFDDIERWIESGEKVAIARVVDIEGSGPRDPGAAMAVNARGEVAGSVSGGCVEGAVVGEAIELLEGRRKAGGGGGDPEGGVTQRRLTASTAMRQR